MVTIIKEEIPLEESLKKKIDMMCEFANVSYNLSLTVKTR